MNPSPCFFFLETGWKRDGKFLLWRGESFVSRRVAYARRGSESGGERSFITLGSPVGKRAERFLLLACIVGKVILDFRELFVVESLGSDRGHFRDSALPRRSLENPHICLNRTFSINREFLKKNVLDVHIGSAKNCDGSVYVVITSLSPRSRFFCIRHLHK